MPLPIQTPKVTEAVHREYGIVGRYRAQIDEVVVPVVQVANLAAETAPLVRTAVSRFTQGAVVGERTTWRLETPAGVYCIVEGMGWAAGGATDVDVFFGSSIPAPAAIAPETFVDGRLRESGQAPAATLAFGTQVAALAVAHLRFDGGSTLLPVPNVIPGSGWTIGRPNAIDFLECQCTSGNIAFSVWMQWREVTQF
jgi:hypothetical protein